VSLGRLRRLRRAAADRALASSSAAIFQITRRMARVKPGVCGKRSRVVTINLTTSFFWRRWRLVGIGFVHNHNTLDRFEK